jgi:hypothetical protein
VPRTKSKDVRRRRRPPGKHLTDWTPAPWNPREISPAARAALAESLRRFGDLSGFVVNRRSGTVICGHQRRECLGELKLGRVEFGRAHRVELAPSRPGGKPFVSTERDGVVEAPGGMRFRVREVSWPKALERAANVAANSPLLAGEFTDALPSLLAEIATAEPDMSAALLFPELLAESGGAAAAPKVIDVPPPPAMTWVLVGIPTVRFGEIAPAVERLAGLDGVECEVTATNAN